MAAGARSACCVRRLRDAAAGHARRRGTQLVALRIACVTYLRHGCGQFPPWGNMSATRTYQRHTVLLIVTHPVVTGDAANELSDSPKRPTDNSLTHLTTLLGLERRRVWSNEQLGVPGDHCPFFLSRDRPTIVCWILARMPRLPCTSFLMRRAPVLVPIRVPGFYSGFQPLI